MKSEFTKSTNRDPLKVFLTVDTELWPRNWDVSKERGREALAREFHGQTPSGEFGVGFQIEMLNRYGLQGVFFLEAYCASVLGDDILKEMVSCIQEGGQEVQLHIHTEWDKYANHPVRAGLEGQHLRDYSESMQTCFLEIGLENLERCGSNPVCAFRAGNYGANLDTLRACRAVELPFDSSYNFCYLGTSCSIDWSKELRQPYEIQGVCEVPINCFEDRPYHRRHLQLRACSFQEIAAMMMEAWRLGWKTFTIVSHSFELLNIQRTGVDPLMVQRFEKLCQFLAGHPEKFSTCGFQGLERESLLSGDRLYTPLRSHLGRTLWRFGEQLVRRLYARSST